MIDFFFFSHLAKALISNLKLASKFQANKKKLEYIFKSKIR